MSLSTTGTTARIRSGVRRDDWLVGQLPVGMLEDDLFVRLVRAFQDVADTVVEGADNVTAVADAAVAPPAMVRYLGRWVGLDLLDPSSPEPFQRDLVRVWGEMLAWRGTRRGLCRFLELVTGAPVEVDDGGGVYLAGEVPAQPAVVRVRVTVPDWLPEGELRALVEDEVPAHIAHELELVDRG
ncbi:phage tail protein [soil metagenome]